MDHSVINKKSRILGWCEPRRQKGMCREMAWCIRVNHDENHERPGNGCLWRLSGDRNERGMGNEVDRINRTWCWPDLLDRTVRNGNRAKGPPELVHNAKNRHYQTGRDYTRSKIIQVQERYNRSAHHTRRPWKRRHQRHDQGWRPIPRGIPMDGLTSLLLGPISRHQDADLPTQVRVWIRRKLL